MKKSFQILLWCCVLAFSVSMMAQDVVKIVPPNDGPAPYHYVAPLIVADNSISVYPMSVNYWTGTCNTSSKTQTSLVNGINTELGWMVFDVSGIPDGSTINSITFNGYLYDNGWPYWSITPMGTVNPVIDAASTIYTQVNNSYGQGTAYSYNTESGTLPLGWLSRPFEPQAFPDLAAALAQDWFAIGVVDWDFSTSYYVDFQGWNEANVPYLVVDYTVPIAHDVATQSIDLPGLVPVGATTPKATVKCNSTTSETFDVTMTISPGGYSSTKTVTSLSPGATYQVSFDNWNATQGIYSAEVCTQLGTDPNPANNCLDKDVTAALSPILGYGFNAYDPTSTVPLGPVSFDCFTPGGVTLLAPSTITDFMCAGTYNTTNQTWYGYQYTAAGPSPYYTIDRMTGTQTMVGNSGISAETMRGLAYDETTDMTYAVSGNNLYTVNNTTGAATLVGPSGLALDYIALACSDAGQLYAFEMSVNALYTINKTTGAATLVAPFPFDVTYAQGADWDHQNNALWWSSWNSGSSVGHFYLVDPTNAALTDMGPQGPGTGLEMDATAFWADIVPVEMTSFTADVQNTDVQLSWITATEKNNQGFEVQRSKSGGEFEALSFVQGNGTTTETQYYSYTDKNLAEGEYTYRLKQVDYNGSFEYSNNIIVEVETPKVYSLEQNYPNPFNPSTKIFFSLAQDSKVSLKVYDILGQEVVTLVNNTLGAGVHNVDFNGLNINSGAYFYRLEATGVDGSSFVSVKKMLLTK